MKYSSNIIVLNEDGELEDWEIIAETDSNYFYLYWEATDFDMKVSEVYPFWFNAVKWDHNSARVMLIGLFKIGMEK